LKLPLPSAPDPQINKQEIIFRQLSFFLVFVAALFLSVRQIYSEDIGFHLQAGRWMLENLSFPDKDTFTYAANENKYLDLYWLYQLLMYSVYSVGGSTGLILVNSFFILSSVFLLFKRTIYCSSWILPWIFLLGLIAASPLFEIRPHSLSWFFLSLVLYLLQQYYDGNTKIIRWLPVIMILWVNCHSLFILGVVVIGCYGISIYFRKKDLWKEFLIWSSIAVAVCLINPYGWHGLSLPFEQWFALQKGSVFKENIKEFQTPFSLFDYEFTLQSLFSKWHFFDLFVLTAIGSFIFRYKKFAIHEWLISIIFFYLAYSAIKNTGYFVFAVTPILVNVLLIAEKNKNNKPTKFSFSKKYSRQITIVFLLVGTLLILSVRTNAFYIHYRAMYRFGFGWQNSNLPVKATNFLVKNNLHGKILNQLDFGGYLEYLTRQKVYVDGRLEVMGKQLFSEQVNAVNDEAKKNLIIKYNPDIVLFPYFITPDWIPFFQNQSEWRLVYVDECAAIYLKNNYMPAVQAINEKTISSSYTQYSDPKIDSILQNKKNASILSSFWKTQYYPAGELNKSVFCFYYGWIDAAKQITTDGFKRSSNDYPELYQNLGTIYFQLKDKNRSLFCYEKYLKEKKNKDVEERVRFLKSLK